MPNENLEFSLLNRKSLNTKVKNEIICCEIDIASFSSDVLSFKETFNPPESFIEYTAATDAFYAGALQAELWLPHFNNTMKLIIITSFKS